MNNSKASSPLLTLPVHDKSLRREDRRRTEKNKESRRIEKYREEKTRSEVKRRDETRREEKRRERILVARFISQRHRIIYVFKSYLAYAATSWVSCSSKVASGNSSMCFSTAFLSSTSSLTEAIKASFGLSAIVTNGLKQFNTYNPL
tara:strand:- start:1202 stop:1642 length:441 start_codon:yes stop_codon:yes gene_type:complete